MTNTSSYYFSSDSMLAARIEMEKLNKADLVSMLINERLNDFIANNSDSDDETGVPYIGWYWRNTDLANGRIPIGDAGGSVGVMENNKWGYAERDLTVEEARAFTALIWVAYQASRQGGNLAEIEKKTADALQIAGDFIRGLHVPDNRNDY